MPLLAGEFVVHVLNIGAYYVILAVSWNLLAGFTGQFSLAQHAFAAVGAYTSGLLIYHLKTPLFVSIPAGVLAAALGGYLLGRLVLRMRTIYLSIATWAFAETYRIVLTAAYEFTRGDLGLSVPSLYGHVRPVTYYYTFVAVAALCVLATHVILRSPIGYFMRAVKDDQMRAQSLGVDTTRVKLFAFTVSSAMAGLAGVLYAHYVLTLTPSIVDFSEMAKIIIIVVIGGLGHFIGPGARRAADQFPLDLSAGLWRMEPGAVRRRGDRGDALLPGRARRPGRGPVAPLAGKTLVSGSCVKPGSQLVFICDSA